MTQITRLTQATICILLFIDSLYILTKNGQGFLNFFLSWFYNTKSTKLSEN